MTTQTHRTILQIDADASRVERAGRVLDRALDDKMAKRLNETLRKLDQRLGKLSDDHKELAKATNQLADAQKRLNDEFARGAKGPGTPGGGGGGGGGSGGGSKPSGPAPWNMGGTQHTAFVQAAMRGRASRAQAAAGNGFLQQGLTEGWTSAAASALGVSKANLLAGGGLVAAGYGAYRAGGMMGNLGWGQMGSLAGGASAGAGLLLSGLTGGASVLPGLVGGGFLNTVIPQAGQQATRAEQYLGMKMQAAPYLMPGKGYEAAGLPFGLDAMGSLSAAMQYAQARGGVGVTDLSLQTALAGQEFGASAGTAGAYARMFRPGRGARLARGHNVNDWYASDIYRAQRSKKKGGFGLRGSEVNEFLAYQINTMQALGQQGVTGDPRQQMGLSSWLGGHGFQGVRGAQVAGGVTMGFNALGRRGASSALDIAMMRAAGYEPGSGAAGYSKALLKMQKPDASLIGKLLKGTLGTGMLAEAPEDARTLYAQRMMQQLGAPVGPDEARQLAKFAVGKGAVGGAAGTGKHAADQIIKEALVQRGIVDPDGAMTKRAATTNEQLETGKALLKTAQSLDGNVAKLNKLAKPLVPVLEKVSGAVEKLSEGVGDMVDRWMP